MARNEVHNAQMKWAREEKKKKKEEEEERGGKQASRSGSGSRHQHEQCSSGAYGDGQGRGNTGAHAHELESSGDNGPHRTCAVNPHFFVRGDVVLRPLPAPRNRVHDDDDDDDVDDTCAARPQLEYACPRAEVPVLRLYSRSLHAQMKRAKLELEPEDADEDAGGEALTGEEYAKLDRLRRVFREEGNTAECRPPMGMQAGVGEWR